MRAGSVLVFDQSVARQIRLLALDVDGVLTENDVWIGELAGERAEFKRFDIQDGLGIRLLSTTAIEVAWVTGRQAPSTLMRAAELKVTSMITVEPWKKVEALDTLLRGKGIDWKEVAFVGDDIPDLPVLQRVGLAIAVANARAEIKNACAYVTEANGGRGAVREVIDLLLKARGEYDDAVAAFLRTTAVPA